MKLDKGSEFTTLAVVKDGELKFANATGEADATAARSLKRFLRTVGEGVLLDWTIKEHQDIRSLKANAYYWRKVIDVIAEETGNTTDDVHDAMCEMFIPLVLKEVKFYVAVTGDTITVKTDGKRSSGLSREKFYEYVERVRAWAGSELGIVTEDPDPDYWKKAPKKGKKKS